MRKTETNTGPLSWVLLITTPVFLYKSDVMMIVTFLFKHTIKFVPEHLLLDKFEKNEPFPDLSIFFQQINFHLAADQ